MRANPFVVGDGLDHQQPLDVREGVRLREMAERVALLLLDPRRIGIRDPDEDLVGLRRGPAQVLQVPVVEGLEAPVDHPEVVHAVVSIQAHRRAAPTETRAKPGRPVADIASDVSGR